MTIYTIPEGKYLHNLRIVHLLTKFDLFSIITLYYFRDFVNGTQFYEEGFCAVAMFCKLRNISIRKALPIVLLSALFVCAFLFTVFISAEYSPKSGTVTNLGGLSLNIRADAGTNYDVIGKLYEGDSVYIVGEKTGSTDGMVWYKIEGSFNGYNEGYVRSDYITVETDETDSTTSDESSSDESSSDESSSDTTDEPSSDTTDTSTGDTSDSSSDSSSDTSTSDTTDEPEEDIPVMTPEQFEDYMNEQGFPESYKEALRKLHEKYPSWIFKAHNTGFDFDYAVGREVPLCLVWWGSPSSWMSTNDGDYNWDTNKWTSYDGDGWARVSEEIVRYYMDSRNFLDETSIFQFLEQSYDANIQNISGVKRIIKGSFMERDVIDTDGTTLNYASAIFNAGAEFNVNPYVLASMIIIEQGYNSDPSEPLPRLIRGDVYGYENLFNYFNVGAYRTSSMTTVERGFWYAKGGSNGATSHCRPWNTRLKSIRGGASNYANGYTNAGQTTYYLKKFNVQGKNPFTHQYMTNVQGAYSEGITIAKAYTEDLRATPLTFYIPVYDNMPDTPCVQPTVTGSPNMKLNSLSVDGYTLTPEFETDILEYMLVVPPSVNKINISAVSKDPDNARIEGTGEFLLNEFSLTDTQHIFEIKVTAGNGDVRVYKITVAKEDSSDYGIVEFHNAYGIKYASLYGIAPNTTVAEFKSKFILKGRVDIKTESGSVKSDTDTINSGDIVMIYTTTDKDYGQYPLSVLGDLDADGKISVGDMLKARNKILGTSELSDMQFLSADIDGDGRITIGDLLKIRNHLLGTSTLS